jgi:hypothetical protein
MSLRKEVSFALSVEFVRGVRGLTGNVDFGVAVTVDIEVRDLLLDLN